MDKSAQQQLASRCDDVVPDQSQPSDCDNSHSTFDFSERTWKEDFTLIVEGEKLYVSKNVLALVSPVFNKMFQAKHQTEMEFPGKKVSEMRVFLRSFYPGMREVISDTNVYQLLPLAEEYQVTSVKEMCEKFLISRYSNKPPADDFKEVLHHAAKYNMEHLLDKFCEEVPEQLAKEVVSNEIILPPKASIKILDKMMSRFEKVNKQNAWLEGVHKYIVSGFSRAEKDKVRRYEGCYCKSVFIKVKVEDYSDVMTTTETVELFDKSENCTISIYNKTSPNKCIFVDISFDDETVKKSKIKIYGRLVIINATGQNENFTFLFEMDFNENKLKSSASRDFISISSGFKYYSSVDAEIHLMAKREEDA